MTTNNYDRPSAWAICRQIVLLTEMYHKQTDNDCRRECVRQIEEAARYGAMDVPPHPLNSPEYGRRWYIVIAGRGLVFSCKQERNARERFAEVVSGNAAAWLFVDGKVEAEHIRPFDSARDGTAIAV